jgi:hypothetical protein
VLLVGLIDDAVSILNLFCRSPCDPNFVDINKEDLEMRFEYGYHNIFLYQVMRMWWKWGETSHASSSQEATFK